MKILYVLLHLCKYMYFCCHMLRVVYVFLTFLPFLLYFAAILDDIRLFCLPVRLIKFQYSDTVTFESGQVWCCIGDGGVTLFLFPNNSLLAPGFMLSPRLL